MSERMKVQNEMEAGNINQEDRSNLGTKIALLEKKIKKKDELIKYL